MADDTVMPTTEPARRPRFSFKYNPPDRIDVSAGLQVRMVDDDEDNYIGTKDQLIASGLVADGMFLVGLDIVGDKLMEINVFSPGGLGSAQSFEGVNFATAVIMALERKVQYMGYYQRNFNNVDMATL